MKMKISASSSCDELKRLLIDVDDYPAASAQYNYEVDTALCGHALIEIAKRLRERNTRIFSCDDDFERVYTKLIGNLSFFLFLPLTDFDINQRGLRFLF